MNEWATGDAAEDDILDSREKQAQIASRESDYQKRRFRRNLDEEKEGRTYKEVMAERELQREEERVKRLIEDKKKEEIARGGEDDEMDGVQKEYQATLKDGAAEEAGKGGEKAEGADGEEKPKPRARKRRWDVSSETPATNGEAGAADGAQTNGGTAAKKSRWDMTPAVDGEAAPAKRRSKWDLAPTTDGAAQSTSAAAPVQPVVGFGTDISTRNAPLSDEELDEMLPSEGFMILTPPP
ncbi:hypothetical protein KC355_g21998, partial [Hortaea werneckii]